MFGEVNHDWLLGEEKLAVRFKIESVESFIQLTQLLG